MFRPIQIALAITALATLAPSTAHAAPCWAPPVTARVTDPFREPACRWCAGNRGIEYGTPPGTTVRAVAGGRVSFAGDVAGTTYVVVRHRDGLRTTYGNLRHTHLDDGDLVVRGARVGTTDGRLHFGLRDGSRYVDPSPYLGRWMRRPRLIPVDGSPGRPSPPATLRCTR
ncbi:MAG: M23 family metallopeptidase [Ilumatobacter sp.]|uniref:murein hydrolase activator EnvC family protein n=1 Tax=Ilumatobacter sp. TaxID=1967498 RepID=UPI0026373425|nr:M23 family metallopeptidase [Ilumatobacter sp.]MDJ0768593.1 M23 family metallopeptidase [Ilumatobacter sp.]